MKPQDLVLRCYADNSRGYWAAYCLDLTLYAVGDTFEEARDKLDEAISDYVLEAVDGPDAAYVDQLIPRRAPWPAWVRYYWLKLRKRLGGIGRGGQPFRQAMPLVPVRIHH